MPDAKKSMLFKDFKNDIDLKCLSEQGLHIEFRKRFFKDTLTYVPGSIIPAAINVISISIFTRIFSPEEYGIYSVVISTLGILNLFLSCWIQQATLRYRAQYIGEGKLWFFNKNFLILLVLVSSLFLLVGLSLYPWLYPHMANYMKYYWPSLGYVVTFFWFSNLSYILMSDLRPNLYSIFVAGNSFLSFIISFIWVMVLKRDITGLVWGMFLSSLFLTAPLLITTGIGSRNIKEIKSSSQFLNNVKEFLSFLRRTASYGFPLIGWFLGTFLLNISDRYLIQIFRGSREVGIYSPNYNLVMGAFALVSAPFFAASYPLLMKTLEYKSGDKHRAQQIIAMFSRYYLLVSAPIYIFLSVFSKEIVSIFLDEAYREGHIIIPIILFGYLAWNLAMFGHKGLEIEGRTKTMLLYVIICAFLNLALNFLFVPFFGYVGAAITSLVGLVLYPILIFVGTRKIFPWKLPWKNIIRISLASAITAFVLILFRSLNLIKQPAAILPTAALLAIFTYTISIYFMGEANIEH
jgi:O-antigen/teichoic acid export membrane protein